MRRSASRSALLLAALVCGVAPASLASADLVHHPRAVDVTLHPTYADVSVMVSMTNQDASSTLTDVYAPLGGGFATDLAMTAFAAGSSPANTWWRQARFTDPGTANQLVDGAFDGSGAGEPLVALWQWEDPYSSRISTTIRAHETTTIAYKLVVPIEGRTGGKCYVSLDGFGDSTTGMTNIRLGDGLSALVVDGVKSPDGAAAVDIAAGSSVEFDAPTTDSISGDVAVLQATDGAASDPDAKAVIDAWFDTATRLGEVPEKAHVVVVVDQSKSIHAPDRDGLIRAARAYVSHFDSRGGEVAIVTFDRRATSTPFLSPSDASEALAALVARPAGNGSNVDAALTEAGRLLGPLTGPRRVVVFSDLEAPNRIDPGKLVGVLPSGALLHVVRFEGAGEARLTRDDYTPWAAPARATGGLAWGASADADTALARGVFEELARPMRLDLTRVTPTLDDGMSGEPTPFTVDEGTRWRTSVVGSIIPASFEVEGELWSTKVTRTVVGTAGYRKLAAGRLFTRDGQANEMDPGRRKEMALFAHALSPDTSFVIVEGKGGYGNGGSEGGRGRLGGSHRSRAPTVRMGSFQPDDFDFDASLKSALRPLAEACGATDLGALRVRVDTTVEEIVDVEVEGAPTPQIASCIEEGTWQLDLDPSFARVTRKTWLVDVGR